MSAVCPPTEGLKGTQFLFQADIPELLTRMSADLYRLLRVYLQALAPVPSPYTARIQSMAMDSAIDEFNWQDGLTAEQLMDIPESLDPDALSWIPTELYQ